MSIELRPEVRRFAEVMEIALRKHDKDRGVSWKTVDLLDLRDGLDTEYDELTKELDRTVHKPQFGPALLKECADVANFCMFLADRRGLMQWSAPIGALTANERDLATVAWVRNNLNFEDQRTQSMFEALLRVIDRQRV